MHCPVWVGVIQKIGVFHQIVTPISNSESTDFDHEYSLFKSSNLFVTSKNDIMNSPI